MLRFVAVCALLFAGCNVRAITESTGGVPPGAGGVCPDGVTIVLSDYISTQVALAAPDATPLSPSFLSSGSTVTSGLSFALSGDVSLPSERPPSGRVVLIDRFGTNVITWADPVSARVTAQLPVAVEFDSNPQDYIEVGPARAYVSRYGHNAAPGQSPLDAGDDVLVIDTEAPRLVGSIPLPLEDDLPPRPTRFARLGARIIVTLDRASVDFQRVGDAELVGLDPSTDSIAWQKRLSGLKNCGRAVPSPSGTELAVACSGQLSRDGEVIDVTESGIVLLDAQREPPVEIARFDARSLAGEAIQSDVAFASDRVLLFKTQTALGGENDNRLLAFDRQLQSSSEIHSARPGGGRGIVLGGLLCSPGCSDLCLLADASRRTIQRFRIHADGSVSAADAIEIERRVGLPPVALTFR